MLRLVRLTLCLFYKGKSGLLVTPCNGVNSEVNTTFSILFLMLFIIFFYLVYSDTGAYNVVLSHLYGVVYRVFIQVTLSQQ